MVFICPYTIIITIRHSNKIILCNLKDEGSNLKWQVLPDSYTNLYWTRISQSRTPCPKAQFGLITLMCHIIGTLAIPPKVFLVNCGISKPLLQWDSSDMGGSLYVVSCMTPLATKCIFFDCYVFLLVDLRTPYTPSCKSSLRFKAT